MTVPVCAMSTAIPLMFGVLHKLTIIIIMTLGCSSIWPFSLVVVHWQDPVLTPNPTQSPPICWLPWHTTPPPPPLSPLLAVTLLTFHVMRVESAAPEKKSSSVGWTVNAQALFSCAQNVFSHVFVLSVHSFRRPSESLQGYTVFHNIVLYKWCYALLNLHEATQRLRMHLLILPSPYHLVSWTMHIYVCSFLGGRGGW